MPARTLYPNQSTMDWSEPKWSEADDDAENQPKPIADDSVVFEGGAGVVTMDEDSAALVASALGAGTIIGTSRILNTGAATYAVGGIATNLSITVIAGTHNWAWDTSVQPLAALVIPDGAKINMTGRVRAQEITIGSGVGGISIVTSAARDLYLYADASGVWHQTPESGAVSPDDIFFYVGADIELGYVNASAVANSFKIYTSGGSRTLTMTGAWNVGTKSLGIDAISGGTVMTIDSNGYGVIAGVVTLGRPAADDKSGVFLASTGGHSFTSIVAGDEANQNNAYDFGTGLTRLSTADNDFSHMSVFGAGGRILANAINHCEVVAGHWIIAWGVKVGSDCAGEIHQTPRQLDMMPLAA